MTAKKIKIILAQLNLTVGDINKNTVEIITAINAASNDFKADLIIFPELSICSYPPEDLLIRPAFYRHIKKALFEIVENTHGIYVLLGHPHTQNENLYNACSLINRKKLIQTYFKQNLPNYGVFDEKRYFTKGSTTELFEINGVTAAISICEDIWVEEPLKNAAADGAEIMFNINASPYHKNKLEQREKVLTARARESNINIVYTNLVGGQDELVFDGSSMVINNRGEPVFRAPQFEQGLYSFDLDINNPQGLPMVYPDERESIYRALVLGVRDYIHKNHFNGAIIGLSGGIDSALTLCIAVDALGAENVEAIIMPSRYTAQMSIDDATTLSANLDVKYRNISIESPFNAFLEILEPVFKNLPADITEENIQARCRGLILMAISNKTGKLVLTTGNKSEMAVGYATLYGDMAGGFAPLKDVWKTMVYKLAKWRNKKDNVIPANIINRPPSAELRPGQLDRDSLPDYETLDPILVHYIENDKHPDEIIASGYAQDRVYQVINLVDKNEYKRRQAAPGIRITQRAFGRDRRYPVTSGYKES